MEILEEEGTLAEILSKTVSGSRVQAVIGGENDFQGMKDCSMITASYRLSGEPIGTVGILGPVRLPYERIISVVNFMAEAFSERLRHY
jgi:heat-inducible transcriptional repressor